MKNYFTCAFAVLLPAMVALGQDQPESITVSVVGTLRTGMIAIGGETTGTTITAKGIKWELELGQNAELRAAAEKLNGKQARVTGTLERRAGVEVKERWIVTVTSLKEASAEKP